MTVTLPAAWNEHEGGAPLRYRVDSRFGADGLPKGAWFGRVSAVVTDRQGRVVVFHRGPAIDPVVILDTDGRHLASWNAGVTLPHGLRVGPDGNLWLTDCGTHRVLKTTPDGEVLLELGTYGVKGTDERTFNAPTDVGFGPDGSVYVSDGYGNSRVVRFDADGRYQGEWGHPGTRPGEFDTPHSVAVAPDGLVWVSDRENHRIQMFEPDGRYVREWNHLGATQSIEFGPDGELWVVTHRNIDEVLTFDSLAGRLMRVDPATGEVQGSAPVPGHFMHRAPTGELWVAGLNGTVIRFRPGWLSKQVDVAERSAG